MSKNKDKPLKEEKKVKKRKIGNHYIDNERFGKEVSEHVENVKKDIANNEEPRGVSNYIAESFFKISDGLSHSSNFVNYTYREDMVMDGVENCIRYINNYDINKKTRTGKPNAFSYFTQFCWYAFLRRIAKEKKQTQIKQEIIDTAPIDIFANFNDEESAQIGESVIQRMRNFDPFYDDMKGPKPEEVELPEKKKRGRPKAKKKIKDGPLNDFLK